LPLAIIFRAFGAPTQFGAFGAPRTELPHFAPTGATPETGNWR